MLAPPHSLHRLLSRWCGHFERCFDTTPPPSSLPFPPSCLFGLVCSSLWVPLPGFASPPPRRCFCLFAAPPSSSGSTGAGRCPSAAPLISPPCVASYAFFWCYLMPSSSATTTQRVPSLWLNSFRTPHNLLVVSAPSGLDVAATVDRQHASHTPHNPGSPPALRRKLQPLLL
jgi:hypothetical protein